MKTYLRVFCSLSAAVSLAAALSGCHMGGAYAPVNTTNYNLGNSAQFVLLDPEVQDSITCSGIEKHFLADGRLEVVANLRNRLDHPITVQIDCNFKDDSGFSVDEAPFTSAFLSENSTESVKFTSINDKARTFTINVRRPR